MSDVHWGSPGITQIAVRLDGAARVDSQPDAAGGRVPVYAAARDAAVALARVAGYAQWRRRQSGTPVTLTGAPLAQIRGIVRRFLAANPDGGWLAPDEAARLVEAAGVPTVPVQVAAGAEDAVIAADALGYPVAVKAIATGTVHKHHARGVVLGLRTSAAVRSAFEDMALRFGPALTGVVVQPMAHGDLELLVGAYSDPVFGPVVAYGLGGTEADALADRQVRLAPLSDVDAEEMVASIRAAAAYDRAAAGRPLDLAAVRGAVTAVAALAEAVPELTDLDLNPILATGSGVRATDVKARLAPMHRFDPYLRSLR
jgi:hypothetical protein